MDLLTSDRVARYEALLLLVFKPQGPFTFSLICVPTNPYRYCHDQAYNTNQPLIQQKFTSLVIFVAIGSLLCIFEQHICIRLTNFEHLSCEGK